MEWGLIIFTFPYIPNVPQMQIKYNPDLHFVFPDFLFNLHLSTSGFLNVCKCNLRIFAQMYGDVLIRQMYANVFEMYSKCNPDVHFDFQGWRVFFSDEDVLKCTQMYTNAHLICIFPPNVLQMYAKCNPDVLLLSTHFTLVKRCWGVKLEFVRSIHVLRRADARAERGP